MLSMINENTPYIKTGYYMGTIESWQWNYAPHTHRITSASVTIDAQMGKVQLRVAIVKLQEYIAFALADYKQPPQIETYKQALARLNTFYTGRVCRFRYTINKEGFVEITRLESFKYE